MRGEGIRDTGRKAAGRARRSAARTAEAAREAAGDYADEARGRFQEAYDHASEWASDAYERGSQGYRRARRASEDAMHAAGENLQALVAERPYVVGLAGLVAGIVIGAVVTHACSGPRRDGAWDDEEE